VLGVLAGLEVLRTLHELGYETTALEPSTGPTRRAAVSPPPWWPPALAGMFSSDYAWSREDRDGKRFGDELERIGYRGGRKASGHQLGKVVELGVEQGPILEDEGRMIGIVTGVQGIRWYEVTVTGQDPHRRDAYGFAQERAARRGPHDRRDRSRGPRLRAARGRDRWA
jgi:N-carbamoyl-L-amino-acid hydrolase